MRRYSKRKCWSMRCLFFGFDSDQPHNLNDDIVDDGSYLGDEDDEGDKGDGEVGNADFGSEVGWKRSTLKFHLGGSICLKMDEWEASPMKRMGKIEGQSMRTRWKERNFASLSQLGSSVRKKGEEWIFFFLK